MPHFQIQTNLPRSKIPEDFIDKALPVLAKTLGKPVSYCCISIIPDIIMAFNGQQPCAMAQVTSIGALGVEENKKHSKALSEVVEKELGIPSDRMYIIFHDVDKSNIGFKGTTFQDIL